MQWTVEKYAVKYYKLINYTAGESKISFQAQCDFLSILKTESWIKLLQRGMQIGTDQSVKCILVVCSNKALLYFCDMVYHKFRALEECSIFFRCMRSGSRPIAAV